MDGIYIVGIGMTSFGKHADRSLRDLTAEAVRRALADAGCDVSAIEAAWFGNVGQGAIEKQHGVRGQIALAAAGLSGVPITNVENACASASTALNGAINFLRAGQGEVALAVGAEKMVVDDRARVAELFDGCWDVPHAQENFLKLKDLGREAVPAGADADTGPRTVFMDIYAALTRDHIRRFGTTPRQIAHVAAKNHFHSTMNPLSQFRKDFTVDEVLAARPIVWPLTLPMCSPISDGAAAAIVCTGSALRRFDAKRAVRVKASVLAAGRERPVEAYDRHVCRLAAQRAYDEAGVGPKDMSVAEVHDASAFAEVLQSENLQFCAIGDGGPLAESGATKLGGRIPIN
ncbi:MAG TPA: thiolase family protein, partial [Nevskiaceae bacterium]|nr:thiolase family protein [Nevskiaceae bacterium]